MAFFTSDESQALRDAALPLYATGQRFAVFSGVPVAFLAGLMVAQTPTAQLIQDLFRMVPENQPPIRLTDGTYPLLLWLKNAAELAGPVTAEGAALMALWRTASDRLAGQGATPGASTLPESKERIVNVDNRLSVDFFTLAKEAAARVVRMAVPVFVNGARQVDNVGVPISSFGTGWVFGRGGLIITNAHVVRARESNEQPVTAADLDAQVRGMAAEFDRERGKTPTECAVAELVKLDGRLDYAVLQLADPFEDRPPLPLRADRISLDDPANPAGEKRHLPVNIIQHPGGEEKMAAFRDNLVTAVGEDAIRYFTDTEQGSSGSPVCDDAWQVVALHRASGTLGKVVNFQGKDEACVNIGTPIHAILADLRKDPAVWARVGPRLHVLA